MTVTDPPLDLPDSEFNCFLNLRALSAESGDTTLDDFLLSRSFANFFIVRISARRKIFECRKNALQVEIHILVRILDQFLQSDPEQKMVGARVEGEDPIVIGQEKSSFLKPEMKVAALKNFAVLIAENRKQYLVPKGLFERVPVDVEELRKSRAGAILQDIHPPLVLRINNAHVIGHEIGDLTHASLLQRGDHRIEILPRSDRR